MNERDALPGTSGIERVRAGWSGNEWDRAGTSGIERERAASSGIERDRRERSEVRGMGTGALMLTLALAPTLTLALGDETAMRPI